MLYRNAIKPILFALAPEFAHERTLEMLALGRWLPNFGARPCFTHARLRTTVSGMDFPNPVGLAAGCDKNGKAIPIWSRFGFGFVETGTITAQPQPGNPRPRVFRIPEHGALLNRLGFNSEGSEAVARRIARLRRSCALPFPLGINIGKTKLVTGDEATLEDYRLGFCRLAPLADFVVVNVSSPNTPGLRQWQEKDKLRMLLTMLSAEARLQGVPEGPLGGKPVPLFVKISPDMSDADMDDVVEVVLDLKLSGIIATNTTITRPAVSGAFSEAGGLSGRPLRERSLEVMKMLYRRTQGEVPLIGVGGISCAQDAYDRIRAGASLVQVYTALIYEGPSLPRRINRELIGLMERDGVQNIAELVGTAT